MKDADLIDAICKILEPNAFAKDQPFLLGPYEMAYNLVRDKTKQEIREKAEKIAALLQSG